MAQILRMEVCHGWPCRFERSEWKESPLMALSPGPGDHIEEQCGQSPEGRDQPSRPEPQLAVIGQCHDGAREPEGHFGDDDLSVARAGLQRDIELGMRLETSQGKGSPLPWLTRG